MPGAFESFLEKGKVVPRAQVRKPKGQVEGVYEKLLVVTLPISEGEPSDADRRGEDVRNASPRFSHMMGNGLRIQRHRTEVGVTPLLTK